jgi:hypothetical protein
MFFLSCSVQNRFQQFCQFPKFITLELLIGLDCVSNRWTEDKVLCIFHIQFRHRFFPEQPQISFFALLFIFSPELQFFLSLLVAMGKFMFSSFRCLQMDDYAHCTLKEDCSLHTTGYHHPGFPRLLLDTLVRIGYDGPIPDYCCRPYQKHGLRCCEVQVEIPVNPEAPFTGTVIGGDLDKVVERMAHLALTTMCEQRLPEMVGLAILLYLIRDQAKPERQQRLKRVCDITHELFHAGWAQMAKYARYMFNLHLEITRIVAA